MKMIQARHAVTAFLTCAISAPVVAQSSSAPIRSATGCSAACANALPSVSIADSDRTQIFVLGTPHLRYLKDEFRPAQLDALIAVLARYKPDIIGVESMSAELVGELERKGGTYDEVITAFAKDRVAQGHEAQKALGLTRDEAAHKADALWSAVAAATNSADAPRLRSQLVLTLVAAYDINTALLQWSYIPDSLRQKNGVVPGAIATYLNTQLTVPNEISAVSVRLAHQLGIQQLESVDDWEYNDLFAPIADQFTKELEAHPLYKSVTTSTLYTESDKQYHQAAARGNLLPYYLYLNSDAYSIPDIQHQWDIFFKTHLPSGYDRAQAAFWEVRNLDIASHIRKATALHPGKKMLMTIGAAHRPFLDAYLSQMMDVRIVRLQDLVPTS